MLDAARRLFVSLWHWFWLAVVLAVGLGFAAVVAWLLFDGGPA